MSSRARSARHAARLGKWECFYFPAIQASHSSPTAPISGSPRTTSWFAILISTRMLTCPSRACQRLAIASSRADRHTSLRATLTSST
jgi:hypothetical protein